VTHWISKQVAPVLWTITLIVLATASLVAAANVVREDGNVYIVDQTGERWDVTQAESRGFDPRGFQYGIGKNAIPPLDDSQLRESGDGMPSRVRVIAVGEGDEARAYSVPRLTRHEIVNAQVGEDPVAVGY
jgi:hypothetical protein